MAHRLCGITEASVAPMLQLPTRATMPLGARPAYGAALTCCRACARSWLTVAKSFVCYGLWPTIPRLESIRQV